MCSRMFVTRTTAPLTMLKLVSRGMAAICLVLVAGCLADPPTVPKENLGPPGVRIISGANVTDTATYVIPEPLVVEVRDDNGRLAVGRWVYFQVRAHGDPSRPNESTLSLCSTNPNQCFPSGVAPITSLAAKTDSAGRASVRVQLGRVAGPGILSVYAPEFGKPDSALYTVLAGPAFALRLAAVDTLLDIGVTANLRARVVDRLNNPRPELPVMSLSSGAAVTLDATSGIATARELGTQWLIARAGALIDSTRVRVAPAGRLLVWSPTSETVRLVNINGTNTRTIMNFVKAPGTMPVFSASRQRVSFRHGYYDDCCNPNSVVVVDTTGVARRDVDPTYGFQPFATRQVADGSVLIVGTRNAISGLWRFAPDSSITLLATLPGTIAGFGATDISHDGTRVAYAVYQNSNIELRIYNVAAKSFTVLEPNGLSPRWSLQDDRVAFLVPNNGTTFSENLGFPAVANADGSGRRVLNTTVWQLGIGWSPDGNYLIGRKYSVTERELQVLRVSDGKFVPLTFRDPGMNFVENYQQPDWR